MNLQEIINQTFALSEALDLPILPIENTEA